MFSVVRSHGSSIILFLLVSAFLLACGVGVVVRLHRCRTADLFYCHGTIFSKIIQVPISQALLAHFVRAKL